MKIAIKRLPFLVVWSMIFFSCKKEKTAQSGAALEVLKDSLSQTLTEIHGKDGIKGLGVAIVNADTILYLNFKEYMVPTS